MNFQKLLSALDKLLLHAAACILFYCAMGNWRKVGFSNFPHLTIGKWLVKSGKDHDVACAINWLNLSYRGNHLESCKDASLEQSY